MVKVDKEAVVLLSGSQSTRPDSRGLSRSLYLGTQLSQDLPLMVDGLRV